LEAFLKINRQFSHAKLILVGGGPEEKSLKSRITQAGLQKNVILTGKLPKKEVVKYYAGADLFVFTSVTETQGLVIAEAKAAGLPVVAVKAYGVSEMVINGEDGFLTELNQNDFIEKTLLLLSDDSVREKFARQAKVNAGVFSSRKCALTLAESYQKLLNHVF
jgi:glycosyltransferase involved in cell wall biosynthesis